MKQNEIKRLLPEIFQRTARDRNPLGGLLRVMETLHEPSEAVLASLDSTFDPLRCPDEFVTFLAGWVDLERIFDEAHLASKDLRRSPITTGLGRLRSLISAAAELSQWRGTARGMLHFLRTATGEDAFAIDEQVPGPDGRPRPFHITVRAPESAADHKSLLERIIELEKPAYVTYQLVFEKKTGQPGKEVVQ